MLNTLSVLLGLLALVVGGLTAFMLLAPEKFTALVLNFGRSRAGLVRKEIVLPDGLRYVYLEGGRGEPLLLLHGFGANKDSFVAIARLLVSRYRVIIPDHIGFGESAHPVQVDYGPDAQAARLRNLLRGLNITGKVHVAGNSMGGLIALHYGLLHPDEVSDLWLLAPAGVFSAPQTAFQQTVLAGPNNPILVSNTDDLVNLIKLAMARPPFLPRAIFNVLAKERIANHELEKKVLTDLGNGDTENRIAGLSTPTLIVWGSLDNLLHPDGAGILHKLLPNSKVVLMSGIGHLPMMEDPGRSAADFFDFQARRTQHQPRPGVSNTTDSNLT